MTINEVKRDLPPVKVRYNGNLYWGKVTGRLNAHASVSPHQRINNRQRVEIVMGPIYEVAWQTVANCVTNDRPIILE